MLPSNLGRCGREGWSSVALDSGIGYRHPVRETPTARHRRIAPHQRYFFAFEILLRTFDLAAASVTAISPTCADAPGLSSPEIRTVNMGVPSYSTKVEKEWSCT